MTSFDTPRKEPLENIVGKGENAGNQHFLLFLQCFTLKKTKIEIFGSIDVWSQFWPTFSDRGKWMVTYFAIG